MGSDASEASDASAEAYTSFVRQFRRNSVAVDVSFRKLVTAFAYGERATHFIHPYPAKLLAHIPYFFLNNRAFCQPDETILDPFCGSGTTLLEAQLSGHAAIGIDVNPFAALLARVKTTPVSPRWLRIMSETAIQRRCTAHSALKELPGIPNPELWYSHDGLVELRRLQHGVFQCSNAKYRRVLMIALSQAARSLSLADPRMPVPVRVRMKNAKTLGMRQRFASVLRNAKDADAVFAFRNAVEKLANRIENYRKALPARFSAPTPSVFCDSVLHPSAALRQRLSGSVDAVITSPPYCGAQKYVRSTSLSLGWLNLVGCEGLSELEQATVGREHIRQCATLQDLSGFPLDLITLVSEIKQRNKERAAIVANYFVEMRLALANILSWLKPGGRLVLIIGDSYVCGRPVPTTEVLRHMLAEMGAYTEVVLRDDIVSRGLLTTRKGAKTVIASENVVVLRKEME